MPGTNRPDRGNQRLRTRKDILRAAGRLLERGHVPTLEEVAQEALVSRATAYRYFPSMEDLLIEAPLELAVPDAEAVLAKVTARDPARRADEAEAILHDMVYRNEAQLRLMLASCLAHQARNRDPKAPPVRQNRRTALIEAALAPARGRFTDAAYGRLCSALALVFGVESMVVFGDVLGVDANEARKVKSWAIQALVRAALADSRKAAGR